MPLIHRLRVLGRSSWKGWVLLWCWWAFGACGAWSAEVPVVVLGPSPDGVSLVGKIGVLEDATGTLGIDEIRLPAVDARFAVPTTVPQAAGLDLHARWFKIRVRQTTKTGHWLIDTYSTAVRIFSVYGPYDSEGRALAPVTAGGMARPLPDPLRTGDRYQYGFSLAEPGDYTLYFQTVSEFPENYRFTAWDVARFAPADHGRTLFDGICYGLLVGMLIYNLMLLSVFRENLYGYNFLAGLFALGSLVAINGHFARYVLMGAREWIPVALAATPALWIAFAGLFGRSFLALPRHAPRLAWSLVGIVPFCGLAVVLALMGEVGWSLVLTQALAALGPVIVFAGAVIALRQGFQPAAWYIAGLSVLFIAAIGTTLNNFGVLDMPFHYEALQIGMVIEGTVFVIALGSRIRRMQQLNGELGRHAKRLTRAAQTDALTGLFNRSGWTHHGPRVLARGGRAALLLIDLDHFKPVNDQHGHAAGDKVLASVSRRLLNEVGQKGVVARLGGDEFVVLLADAPDTELLRTQAERLIRLVSQPVLFEGHALKVGCSIGIARAPADGEDLSVLMHAADRAMYFIKKHGRAGCAFSDETSRVDLAAA